MKNIEQHASGHLNHKTLCNDSKNNLKQDGPIGQDLLVCLTVKSRDCSLTYGSMSCLEKQIAFLDLNGILLMQQQELSKQKATHNSDHGKQDDQSDCQDCRRQRQENKLLINMYEKLKNIEGKVDKVQSTLKQHLSHVSDDAFHLSSLSTKLDEYNQNKSSDNSTQVAGLELAKELIERKEKHKLEEENKVLKQLIQKMRAQHTKRYAQHEQSREDEFKSTQKATTSLLITQRVIKIEQPNDPAPLINNPELQTPKALEQTSTQYLQSQSTHLYVKSQSSLLSRPRKQPKKNMINELSLWLFDNVQNSRLQNQLYSKEITTKNESYFERRSNSRYGNLPTIRQRSDSKRRDSKLESTRFESKLPIINRRKT